MLFDLKGRRRRVVQATYLTLAVLMGGGLVLFGIGGDVSGGLFDAFSDRSNSSGNGNETFKKRRDEAQERLQVNPRDQEALKSLVRAEYQLASSQVPQGSNAFPEDTKDELRGAASAWERYLALKPEEVDTSLATLMLQAYGAGALNQPDKAVRTAEIVARARDDTQSYLLLVQYATLAGQTRTANLAAQKAIDLAPRDQRSDVKRQVDQLKSLAAAQQAQGQPGGSPGE